MISRCVVYAFPLRWLGHTSALGLVEEVDDDVVLLDAESVEVLADSVSELVFALPSEFCPPSHRRRMQANATGAR